MPDSTKNKFGTADNVLKSGDTMSGSLTASSFIGDGSDLTNIPSLPSTLNMVVGGGFAYSSPVGFVKDMAVIQALATGPVEVAAVSGVYIGQFHYDESNYTPSLTSVEFTNLLGIYDTWRWNASALLSLSFPMLRVISCRSFDTTSLDLGNCVALTSISIPSLVSVTGGLTFQWMSGLADLVVGTVGITKSIVGSVDFRGNALTQASVDRILAVMASLDGTNGTTAWGTGWNLYLNGGTNSEPSVAGWANYDIIVARGANVSVNGVHP